VEPKLRNLKAQKRPAKEIRGPFPRERGSFLEKAFPSSLSSRILPFSSSLPSFCWVFYYFLSFLLFSRGGYEKRRG